MKSVLIKLNSADKVKDFVRITSKYDYDIDVRSGRYVVNAKSILGIFSLDLSRPVVLEIYNDSCQELLDEVMYLSIKK